MGAREILISTGIPVAIAAIVFGFLWLVLPRITRKNKPEPGEGPRFALPILAGGLTLFGAYAFQSQIALWPDAVTHRFPALGITAALAGLIAFIPALRARWYTLAPIAAAGGAFAAWMFLSTVHPDFLSPTARALWIAALALATGLNGWILERVGEQLKGFRGPALLWMLIGTVGLGATAGFANAPLITGGASAAFGVLAGIGLLTGRVTIAGGGGVAAAVLITGVAAFANWLGNTERWVMLALLVASPTGAAAVLILGKRFALDRRKNLALMIAAVPALGLAGTQAAIALPGLIAATSGSNDPYGGYDY